MTDASILDHVARLPHARATFKQLVRELGSRVASRDEIENALDRLVERGQLIEIRSGSFVVTRFSREYAVGRLNMHRDGYGFLIPDHAIEGLRGDVYIPRESAQSAMHGDRVAGAHCSHRSGRPRRWRDRQGPAPRASKPSSANFASASAATIVAPHDERIRQWIEIPEGMEFPPAAARSRSRRRGAVQISNRPKIWTA